MAITGIGMADSQTYQKIMEKRTNSTKSAQPSEGDSFSRNILSEKTKYTEMVNQEEYINCANSARAAQKQGRPMLEGKALSENVETEKKAPYSYLADEGGMIVYHGVAFYCDNENQALCLGDMSEEDNILTIPLSEGGCLKVNRNSIGALSKAISMFSPEDINRILSAIEQDNVCTRRMFEIDEMKNSIGTAGEA